jgi:hypothetical protein
MKKFIAVAVSFISILSVGISGANATTPGWQIKVDSNACWMGDQGNYCSYMVTFFNKTKKIQHLVGNYYATTSDGKYHDLYSDGGLTCNYTAPDVWINPGDSAYDFVCFAVSPKTKIREIYISSNPASSKRVSFGVNLRTNL